MNPMCNGKAAFLEQKSTLRIVGYCNKINEIVNAERSGYFLTLITRLQSIIEKFMQRYDLSHYLRKIIGMTTGTSLQKDPIAPK